jgi:acyl-CoA dehydrogenase
MRPFTDDRRDALRDRVRAFAAGLPRRGKGDVDPRTAARALADEGLFRLCVPATFGGEADIVEPLSLVVTREELAFASGSHDALFAVQGLAAHPLALAGNDDLRRRWLPALAQGQALGAFVVTEPEAGSDLGAVSTTARREDGDYLLDGHKIFISNATFADLLIVLARTDDGLTLFAVPAASPGLETSPLELLASHSVGSVRLRGVRVAAAARLGAEGEGLALCLRTLEVFRSTVGAAACGLARRALEEARRRVLARRQFGKPLAENQSVQFTLAEMKTELDAARALVYQAASLQEDALRRNSSERLAGTAASAKLFATEMAQSVVDRALQLHGAAGLVSGGVMEALYREVRGLRIYEGTSEVQKMVIARELLQPGSPSLPTPSS